MIRLKRPAPPQSLLRRAAVETQDLWTVYDAGGQPQVKSGVYNAPDVKAALLVAQHEKCAFCETRDTRSPGAVEHFRPKHGWKQQRSDSLNRPGYFWLGYEWSNLLFSCTMCNDTGHKGNLFPLSDPSKRARPRAQSIAAEDPLLINPYEEDPSTHLEWNAFVPRPKASSPQGQATIDTFGLVTDQRLMDRRRDYLRDITLLVDLLESLPASAPSRIALKPILLDRLDDAAEYAAMIRSALGSRIQAL